MNALGGGGEKRRKKKKEGNEKKERKRKKGKEEQAKEVVKRTTKASTAVTYIYVYRACLVVMESHNRRVYSRVLLTPNSHDAAALIFLGVTARAELALAIPYSSAPLAALTHIITVLIIFPREI